jgi:sugar phosphate isomerase/epimerase
MPAALGPSDLVLCAGTLPRATFRDRVAAAAAGGFGGISLWTRCYERDRAAGTTDAEMRDLLAAHRLCVTEIEAVSDALSDPATVRDAGARELACYAIADAVGGGSITLVEGGGPPLDVARAADAFAVVCARASAHDLRVQVEPWPGSRLDVATAIALLRTAPPNGGILADSWHLTRTAGGPALLAAARDVRILAVQMSDGTLVQDGEYLDETMHRRRVPGDGEFDLEGFVRLLDAQGSRAPIGVEVLSDALAVLPATEVGRRVGAAARRIVERAREAR